MSLKYAAIACLLLPGLFLTPLAMAEADSPDASAESTELEDFPPYVVARDIARNVDENLYPKPQAPTPSAGDSQKTCVALDDEIVALTPLTYRLVPDFYDDPKNAAIIWLTTTKVVLFDFFPDNAPLTEIPLGYSLLAYPGYKKYKEEERIRLASQRIDVLRRVKARKRCFEVF